MIILIAGVDGAGKGETVNLLHEWMDPRGLEAHAFGDPTDEESERPPNWRFWRVMPPKGRIGIFFGAWYADEIDDRVFERTSDAELEASLARINELEKMLTDDGALLIKLWFHLSKKAQKERLHSLEDDPATQWRVTKQDWKNFKRYDAFREVAERVLQATSSGPAPWRIIEGADHRYRSLTAGREILDCANAHLLARAGRKRSMQKPTRARKSPLTLLDTLDLTKSLDDDEYEEKLEKWQGELNLASRQMRERGGSAVLVFEGWDAAGKGGAIRRITSAMDARDYTVIPIAAPTDEERAQHYLWRFWRHLPRAGHMTIFDRSWYGRVLVERVEGYATKEEWMRAYDEIVRFETQLAEHGIILQKFWLHIDRAEQNRRFKARQKEAFKRFKITQDDFRNRDRWNDYELAANEMVERTSTDSAPWELVEANDKQFARIKVLKTVAKRLEAAE
jgi:AMP-polyphosphate phosphotransferase